jgi:DNA-binding response OmpR family regulator
MTRKRWVLFIEDTKDHADIYEEALALAGFNVRTASGGTQGLRAATELEPAAMVVDLGLPDVDGWEVIRRIRGNPSGASVPILILTGLTIEDGPERARLAGCDRILKKPCPPAVLLEAIQSAITHRLETTPPSSETTAS